MSFSGSGRGSFSRLSQMFQRPQSPNTDNRSVLTDAESIINAPNTGFNDGRSVHSPRQRLDSSVGIIGSMSSSMKTPARSYFQRSVHGSSQPGFHNTSGSVRDDTAELASRALNESQDDSSRYSFSRTTSNTQPLGTQSHSLAIGHRNSMSSAPIQEESEPSTPQTVAYMPRQSTSALAELIRNSPPDEEAVESSQADAADSEEEDFSAVTLGPAIISQPQENTPLLGAAHRLSGHGKYGSSPQPKDVENQADEHMTRTGKLRQIFSSASESAHTVLKTVVTPKSWDGKAIWRMGIVKPASCFPAVLLGLLLNVLDALSYGMILFPLGQPIFESLGPDGISMFYVSCIVSQLVYSLGGSIFRGGVGSEMIEVVPFFHKMAFTIMAQVGEDNPRAVIATTILAYSISSVLTGVVFFLMGQCKLGALIGFFPRHILIGCIGGVGFFLVVTGVEVSARLDGNLNYDLDTFNKLIEVDTVPLWAIPLGLSFALLVLKRWVKHSLTDAAYFISIIAVFYIVVLAVPRLSVSDLRGKGWVFEAPEAGEPWYHFYSLYDFKAVDWEALASTIPAMFALTFFGILHVPINVPALGLSTGEDNVDVDRELKAHGYSNALSGLVGSIQNYLVYTNTVLFMRSGGDSRLAGVLLAAATFGILVVGPVIIGYIPVMVVGTLIFFLGFDLMREALVDTVHRVHRLEYLTILIIVVTMGAYDFVVGILVGIVLACVSYVVQTSRISAIRGTLPGGIASSTVRRHPLQHDFLQEVGNQISVMKLAGYLFFGTIVGVENNVRQTLDNKSFDSQPIQFLVIDLSKVDGVDFSAAEAFTRINRILSVRGVRMILCGFAASSEVGKSLQNVGLLDSEDEVDFFEALNPALEFCENELLKAFYQRKAALLHNSGGQYLDVPHAKKPSFSEEIMFNSPRQGQLQRAATQTLENQYNTPQRNWSRYKQPLQLILQTFSSLSSKDENFWRKSIPYFVRQEFAAGTVIYSTGDKPNGFYLLEVGMLKAKYRLPQGTFSEVIVAGATCGELPFFSETERTSTTFAERDCVTFVLDAENWARMQKEQADIAHELLKISLKLTSERMDAITKYMLLSGA